MFHLIVLPLHIIINHLTMDNQDILKTFGSRVQELRAQQGLSQEKLAEKAHVHRTYIGMIERAEKNITLRNIEKIAKALSIDIKELFDY